MTIPMSMSMQIRGRCGDGGRTVTWIRWRSFGSLEIGFRSLLLGADHDVYNNTNFPNNVKFLDLFTLQMDRMSLRYHSYYRLFPLHSSYDHISSLFFVWKHVCHCFVTVTLTLRFFRTRSFHRKRFVCEPQPLLNSYDLLKI